MSPPPRRLAPPDRRQRIGGAENVELVGREPRRQAFARALRHRDVGQTRGKHLRRLRQRLSEPWVGIRQKRQAGEPRRGKRFPQHRLIVAVQLSKHAIDGAERAGGRVRPVECRRVLRLAGDRGGKTQSGIIIVDRATDRIGLYRGHILLDRPPTGWFMCTDPVERPPDVRDSIRMRRLTGGSVAVGEAGAEKSGVDPWHIAVSMVCVSRSRAALRASNQTGPPGSAARQIGASSAARTARLTQRCEPKRGIIANMVLTPGSLEFTAATMIPND